MFDDESWKPIYFRVKWLRSQVTKTLPVWVQQRLKHVGGPRQGSVDFIRQAYH